MVGDIAKVITCLIIVIRNFTDIYLSKNLN